MQARSASLRARTLLRRLTTEVAGVAVVLALVLTLNACSVDPGGAPADSSRTPTAGPTSTGPSASSPSSPDAGAPFNRTAHSVDDPNSIWVVVNKARPFKPLDFTPPDLVVVGVPHVWEPQLRKPAADAVVAMFAAFTAETGLKMQSQSAFRSYDTQRGVYDQDVTANGQAAADTDTARPGTSEHQTGLAIDISALPAKCSLAACFGDTTQGSWLAANAWRFGFLLRYPADKVPITGYTYEPWHFRFVGIDLATEMHANGVSTLEEFFGLPAAPQYK
ncbi:MULTISPECIES: M15 family metallopeptidase [unclassified Cryobacterium]|nr:MULTISPECIES: M15 family metallopeptidase [unclassified Cryobacterium]MDY7541762.1 M15 family metallopeptidase [Cryobacterium sp. 5B3]MEB0000151.1 M15 family metallopeptidase [Cryobacterium sp. RTS3]MEB0266498.1 M15 family metallopeptidase [Cryobacterium sp. 10I5]MEB0275258.1 M15 family metallopeptidase [Cryobacterium sp. 5B3]